MFQENKSAHLVERGRHNYILENSMAVNVCLWFFLKNLFNLVKDF